jgi:predicted transcriptional regulator
MTTLHVGIATYDQFKKRTLAMARGDYRRAAGEPKVWFTSLESFAKVLSEPNRELLRIIVETKPESLGELAAATGRAKSNLSRTLKTMARFGLVHFVKGKGRTLMPRTPYTHVVLDVSLQAKRSRQRTLVPA